MAFDALTGDLKLSFNLFSSPQSSIPGKFLTYSPVGGDSGAPCDYGILIDENRGVPYRRNKRVLKTIRPGGALSPALISRRIRQSCSGDLLVFHRRTGATRSGLSIRFRI